MLTRLWFVLSLAWAAMIILNCMTRQTVHFDGLDWAMAFGPLVGGILLRVVYRYVRYGPRLRDSRF